MADEKTPDDDPTGAAWPTSDDPFTSGELLADPAPPVPPPPPPPPGIAYPVVPPPPHPEPRRRAWMPWAVTAALALVVAAAIPGAALLADRGDDERDPAEALAAAQALVDDALRYTFTIEGEVTSSGGAGSQVTETLVGDGEWVDGSWRLLVDDGYSVTESILSDDTLYERSVESGEDPSDELWAKNESLNYDLVDELEAMAGEVDPATAAVAVYLGDTDSWVPAYNLGISFAGDPSGFLLAVGELSDPALAAESDDGVTLSGMLQAPEDLSEAFGADLPDARVELDLDAEDRPSALRLDVGGEDVTATIEIEFSDWTGEVSVEAPADDEIDETPYIGEDEVRAAAGELTIVAPTMIPDDWDVTLLDTVPADLAMDTTADDSIEECTVVEVDWDESLPSGASEEEWDEAGYLYLWLMTDDCALRAQQTPFEPGGPGGLPSRQNEFYMMLEVQMGDTVVQVDTSLDEAELDPILASLAPADVEALIDEAKAAAAGY